MTRRRRRPVDRHARGLHRPRGRTSSLAGPNGLLETQPAPGDDATWFPNLYDDLTWLGPDKEHGGQLTLFQTPSPLLKYDQLFGTAARQWEAAFSQNKDISRWPGHCLGGAVASILLNEPIPAPGSGMTQDELKSLWAELGENHYNHRIGDYANEIPPGPPRPGPDATRFKVPRVHAMLETHIRGEQQAAAGQPPGLPAPRDRSTRSGTTASTSTSPPTTPSPAAAPAPCRIVLELHANSGSMLNGQDDKDRVVNYEYSLVYGLDGRVDETNPYAADWISVGGEASSRPLNVLEVVGVAMGGPQPVRDRGERPVARPGQRRRPLAGFRSTPAELPAGRRSTRPAGPR